jgi:glycosyltransferase involved in cell wall biosynthesis
MLQDVEFSDHGGDFASLGRVPCVANSRFTAEKYRQAFEVDPLVIHPMIDGNKYRTDTTRENVTFINPHPLKGLDLALSLAEKCPDIPFSFIETWPLSADQRSDLLNRISARPNVRLNPSVTDMKKIYGATKILLAPSRWEEAYGRVASEAQFSGIPVIASNRGGLPEAVGDGGVLLDPDGPIEGWIEALQNLWNNHEYYNEVSNKASLHSRRPALNLDYQIEQWVNAFHSAIDAKN